MTAMNPNSELDPFTAQVLAERAAPRRLGEPDPWEADTIPDLIRTECERLAGMLIEKNNAYGNSALDPIRVFSNADPAEQLRVRIDDKLSRLQRGSMTDCEDTVLDLLGYLILLRISDRKGPAKVAGKSRWSRELQP